MVVLRESGVDMLWREYISTRDISTRNCLVEYYLPWVRKIAGKFHSTLPGDAIFDDSDLLSEGVFGLMEAMESYDVGRGRFETYAYQRVRGAMVDALRRMQWTPRRMSQSLKKNNDMGQSVTPRGVENGDAVAKVIDYRQRDDSSETRSVMLAMIANLDVDRDVKILLVLRYCDGMALQQVGVVLGWNAWKLNECRKIGESAMLNAYSGL